MFSNGILWWYLVQFPLSLIFLATFVAFVDILKIENPHKLSWIYLLQLHTYYFILSCGVICGIRNIMSLIFRNKKRTIRIKVCHKKEVDSRNWSRGTHWIMSIADKMSELWHGKITQFYCNGNASTHLCIIIYANYAYMIH